MLLCEHDLHSVCVLDMAPYYETLCKELKWPVDSDLLSKMKKANEDELKRLDEVLEDAEKNLGESEIRDAMMAKAEYLIRIGDKVRKELRSVHSSGISCLDVSPPLFPFS